MPSTGMLAAFGIFLTHAAIATPINKSPQPNVIPAGTGLTYPGGDAEPSNDITAVMRKYSDRSTPLLEGDCSPYDKAFGPTIDPDTPEAFSAFDFLRNIVDEIALPDGYTLTPSDPGWAINLDQDAGAIFIGGTALKRYDPSSCAAYCNITEGCTRFNTFVERVPTLQINHTDCPNPPSMSAYACTLWGDVTGTRDGATYWADFRIVVAASLVFVKISDQPDIDEPDKRDIKALAPRDYDWDSDSWDEYCSEDYARLHPEDCPEDFKASALSKRDCNGAPVVENGDFEVDDPNIAVVPTGWNISEVKSTVTFGFTKPGSTNNGGTYAFVANLLAPDASAINSSTGFILSQKLNTCAGRSYEVSMDYRVDDGASNQCSIIIGTDAFGGGFGSARSEDPDVLPHTWNTLKLSFMADKPNVLLAIYIGCNGHVWNNYSIDNIKVEKVGEPLKK